MRANCEIMCTLDKPPNLVARLFIESAVSMGMKR